VGVGVAVGVGGSVGVAVARTGRYVTALQASESITSSQTGSSLAAMFMARL
jgi:hypothetical protein